MKSRSQKFRLYKRKVLFLNFLLMTRQTLTHSALKHMKEIHRALHLWNLKNRNRLKQNHLCTVYMSHYSNVSHNPFPVSCITCAWNDRQWLCEGLYMCSFHPFYKPCSVDYVETSMIYWEMSDSYTYIFIYIYVCVNTFTHRTHPVGSKANENLRRLNTHFEGHEMVERFNALNFLQSDRCCPRIESAQCTFHQYVCRVISYPFLKRFWNSTIPLFRHSSAFL